MAEEEQRPPQTPSETPADGRKPESEAPPSEPRTPMTQQVGRIAVIAILVLFTIFAVANSHYVTFGWVFGETEVEQVVRDGDIQRQSGGVPLIILLIVSFVLGAIVGWFVQWRSGRSGAAPNKS